jgi:hypothetical protein
MTDKKRLGHTQLPHELLDNETFSFDDLGLLWYLASHRKSWISNHKTMIEKFNIGKNKLSKKLTELRKLGRLSRVAVYHKETREKIGTQYKIHSPPLSTENRDLDMHPKYSIWVYPKRVSISRTTEKGTSPANAEAFGEVIDHQDDM